MTVGTLDPGDLERDIAAILGIGDAPPVVTPSPMPAGAEWRRHAVPAALLVAASGAVAAMLMGSPGAHRSASTGRETTSVVQVRIPPSHPETRVPVAVAAIVPRDEPRPVATSGQPHPLAVRAVREEVALAVTPRAARRHARALAARVADPVDIRTAAVQPPSAPERNASTVAEAAPVVAPDVRIALAASTAPPPPAIAAPPSEEPPPVRRLKTQRSIDAIRLLRRQ